MICVIELVLSLMTGSVSEITGHELGKSSNFGSFDVYRFDKGSLKYSIQTSEIGDLILTASFHFHLF